MPGGTAFVWKAPLYILLHFASGHLITKRGTHVLLITVLVMLVKAPFAA